jgi:heavy metal sensor kinase
MMRLLTGTRARLTLTSVAIVALALTVAGAVTYVLLDRGLQTSSDAVLVSQAHVIRSSLDVVNGTPSLDTADLPGETSGGIAVDAAVISNGVVIAHTANQPLPAAVLTRIAQSALGAQGGVWLDFHDPNGTDRRVYAAPIALTSMPDAVLVVSRAVGELRSSLHQAEVIGLIAGIGLLVLVGGLTYWMTGRALTPVRRIAGLARSISERDLHRRVEVDVPSDELGDLVTTFNSMLGRLEASFESLRRFSADASHELRAPLTVMRTRIETALRRSRTPEEYRDLVESLKGEVEHLSRLSDHLLILARADAGALDPAREPVDVPDLLEESAARWSNVASTAAVRLKVAAPPAGKMPADPQLLRRVIDNLIDNAIRHSPRGGEVTISGAASSDGWDIDVADEGPGVAIDLKPRLFERFARADGARTPGDGGAGLGLALGEAIARAHGGTLSLMPNGSRGARFRLHLPNRA